MWSVKDLAKKTVVDESGKPNDNTLKMIDKALDIQRPMVVKYVREQREKHPNDTPAQLIERLSGLYLNAVTAGGAAIGATSFVPGVGTAASLGLSAASVVGFLEASGLYAMAVAEIHGVQMTDPAKAKALVMAVMLGEDSSSVLSSLAGQASGKGLQNWGPAFGANGSGLSGQIMDQLKKRFLTRLLTRQGAGALGRAMPFGIGAVIGGGANRVLGKGVIKAAEQAFGAAPTVIPAELAALPSGEASADASAEAPKSDGAAPAAGA